MSEAIVEVCKINKISSHPNADTLEMAHIKGWDCIVKKGTYNAGDSIIFIPPDSLVPKELSERLNIINYLAGKQKNRVKTIKLRGEMSYGLIINNEQNWKVGTDVGDHYGIEKYHPPLRFTMGDAGPEDVHFMRLTKIENVNNFPDTFKEGEMVVVTEKVDGCFREDQKVMLINGEEVEISKIVKGDLVLSYDDGEKEFIASDVEEVIIKEQNKEWMNLYFDNDREIVCTVDHLFLTENRGWVSAEDLSEDDDIINFINK